MVISSRKNLQTLTKAIKNVGPLLPIVKDVHNYLRENDAFQAKLLLEKNRKIVKNLTEIKASPIINAEQKKLIDKIQALYNKAIKELPEYGPSKIMTISEFEGTLEALRSILKKAA